MVSLYTTKAIIILDGEGNRVACKYYTTEYATTKEQIAFEKTLFDKCYRANAEITMFENVIVLYRATADCFFAVVGGVEENELLLLSILNALHESLSILLRSQLDKRTLLENLDYVLLTIDEIVDGGIVMETDGQAVATRVSLRGTENEIPLSEQTLSQALQTAKEQIARSLLK